MKLELVLSALIRCFSTVESIVIFMCRNPDLDLDMVKPEQPELSKIKLLFQCILTKSK